METMNEPHRMLRVRAAALAAVLLLATGAAPAGAQDSLSIAPGRSCPACRVTLTPTLALGADAGVHGPTTESRVARDSRGRYFVAPTYTPGSIAMYGPDGRFRGVFGTEGGGPGEFRGIQNLVMGPGDSLWVVSGGGRITVVDPEQRIVRSITADEGAMGILPRSDGSVAVMNMVGGGGPVLDAAGAEVGRLELSTPPTDDNPTTGQSGVVALPDGRLVALHATRYRLDVLDTDGTRLRTIDRRAFWFPSLELASEQEAMRHIQEARTTAMTFGAAPTATGEVWVLAQRVNMTSVRDLFQAFESGAMTQEPVLDMNELLDAVLELVDVDAGQVVATGGSTSRLLTGFLDGEHVVGVRELEDGIIVLDLWRMGVRGR